MQNASQASCLFNLQKRPKKWTLILSTYLVFFQPKKLQRGCVTFAISSKIGKISVSDIRLNLLLGKWKSFNVHWDTKYGVYEYGYLQVHHLFWCWDRGRVAQEQHCFSHCYRCSSDNFHQPWLGQQKSAKKVVKGFFFYTLTFNWVGLQLFVTVQYKKAFRSIAILSCKKD